MKISRNRLVKIIAEELDVFIEELPGEAEAEDVVSNLDMGTAVYEMYLSDPERFRLFNPQSAAAPHKPLGGVLDTMTRSGEKNLAQWEIKGLGNIMLDPARQLDIEELRSWMAA